MVFPAQGGKMMNVGGMNRTIPISIRSFGKKGKSKRKSSKRKRVKNTKKSVQIYGIRCTKCGCQGDPTLGCPCCGNALSKYKKNFKRHRNK